MIRGLRVLAPRTLVSSAWEIVTPPFETTAAKGTLVVRVDARTGSLEYTPAMQGFDPAASEWYDRWEAAGPETTTADWVFYDQITLFPPSNFVKMLLRPQMRARLALGGSGTMTISVFWLDAITMRQAA